MLAARTQPDEPEPELSLGPTPPVLVEWPMQLECMPAHEQSDLKQEVARARQEYPEGSPMMDEERSRLERKYCVDPDVLIEVFSYVAAQKR